MLLAAGAPAPAKGPAAGAAEQERLDCLGRLQREQGGCIRQAQERCQQEFRERLGGCFGGPSCPEQCLATGDECEKEPKLERDGCRIACQADGRVGQQGCRIEVDRDGCRRTVRTKTLKCREQCNRRATPPLQRCRNALADCLRACAKEP